MTRCLEAAQRIPGPSHQVSVNSPDYATLLPGYSLLLSAHSVKAGSSRKLKKL